MNHFCSIWAQGTSRKDTLSALLKKKQTPPQQHKATNTTFVPEEFIDEMEKARLEKKSK